MTSPKQIILSGLLAIAWLSFFVFYVMKGVPGNTPERFAWTAVATAPGWVFMLWCFWEDFNLEIRSYSA